MIKEYENDDLWYAIENNGLGNQFEEESIVDIVAEIPGENDELSWWWILELQNGKFALLQGWCDYTGWDCRSDLHVEGIFDSAILASQHSPEKDNSGRSINKNLSNQLSGVFPKFTYWED